MKIQKRKVKNVSFKIFCKYCNKQNKRYFKKDELRVLKNWYSGNYPFKYVLKELEDISVFENIQEFREVYDIPENFSNKEALNYIDLGWVIMQDGRVII